MKHRQEQTPAPLQTVAAAPFWICGTQKDTHKARKMSRLRRSCCTSLASAYQAGGLAAALWHFHGFSLHSDVHDHRGVMLYEIKWARTDITVGLASLGLESFSLETFTRVSQRISESPRLIFSGVRRRAALLRHFGTTLIWLDADPKHRDGGQECAVTQKWTQKKKKNHHTHYLARFRWRIWNICVNNMLMLAVSIMNINQ